MRKKIFITGGDGEYLRMAEVMIKSLIPFLGENKLRLYSFDCDYKIEGIDCIRINLPYTPSFPQTDPVDISQTSISSYWGKYHATIHSLMDFEYSVWIDSDCFVTKEVNRIWKYCEDAKNSSHPLFMHYLLGDASYWYKMKNSEIEVKGRYGSEASFMFEVIRNPFGQLAAAGFYLAHANHLNFLKECLDLRYESLKRHCFYYADDKAFSEERLTNLCMWKHGHNRFLPFTWINSETEQNLNRFPDRVIKNLLLNGFDVMFDREDNEILFIHGPNPSILEKNAVNLEIVKCATENPTDKLMIVSHPDDEIIFGGSALLEEFGWRVVCLTNGNNPGRRKEFEESMRNLKIMDYSIYDLEDKLYLPLSVERLESILDEEIGLLNWKKIVTHNNIGEYGHPHHYQVHEMVKSKIDDLSRMWVFDKQREKISDLLLEDKNKIMGIYFSQQDIIDQIRENRGRWFIDKNMETNYIENGIISPYLESSTREESFIACYLK